MFIEAVKMMLALAVVIFLAWWSIRYLLPRLQTLTPARTGAMTVIERVSLGMRTSLCLVKVGERYFLIGVTPASMEYLAEVSEDDLPESGTEPPDPPDFAEILAKSKDKVNMFRSQLKERSGRVQERKDTENDHGQPEDNYRS
ncbi:flagellar biosynthetic protein FliO [Dethiobacter alkaliphilus]|uniref:flagellar biosynthetic protein FliO n=1 Tax=Dethiobacter alkaliphilus TaxID=427926 RepID=UPI00222689E4|nr:flagellar biosynthetic protein FliO [Dethiobacter alkaliphilus]MCW3488735.1 flagellar biosynthetic protein FliO [Dethiobacter alkaliphilus]